MNVSGVPISRFPIDPGHKLSKVMEQIDWAIFDNKDMFFESGFRPLQPLRRIIGLILLERIRKVEGKDLLQQWLETPAMQHFTGESLFHWDLPISIEEIETCKYQITQDGKTILELILRDADKIT
jgi:hypothetical protein